MIITGKGNRCMTAQEKRELEELMDTPTSECRLTDWETDFLESIWKRRELPMSAKQLDRFSEIKNKVWQS